MYFYCGIHKGASTYLINIIKDVTNYLKLNQLHFHSNKHFNYDINEAISRYKLDFVSLTNADYHTLDKYDGKYKAFHVIRDPRDIIVSSYFSHLYSHSDNMWPEINDYREQLKKLDKEQGISTTIDHLSNMMIDGEPVRIFDLLANWNYDNPNIIEIKFEDLTKNPYIQIPIIFEHLNLLSSQNHPPAHSIKFKYNSLIDSIQTRITNKTRSKIELSELLQFIYKHDFYFKSKGRNKGASNDKSHYRKGMANDWKNHLTNQHIAYIKDHFGDLLIKLGYEENLDW